MSEPRATNITWHQGEVSTEERERVFGHQGACLWLTGLSGSGKSTVARCVEKKLISQGVVAYVLDGDNIRHGLNRDLGFSPEDRVENIRRIGEVARLFVDAGVVVLTAFISPYRADRESARVLVPQGRFVEVHVAAPIEVCEARDPKGLYRRARAGEISQFTGISAPYEPPDAAEITIDTSAADVEACAEHILDWLRERAIIRSK